MKSIRSILGNTRRADISFYPNGKIDISSRIVKTLSMEKGDVIDIMVDGREYYLYVSIHASVVFGRHEAQCYPTQRGSRHFRAYSRRLCTAMMQATGINERVSFAAGEIVEMHGHKVLPIITRKNLRHD